MGAGSPVTKVKDGRPYLYWVRSARVDVKPWWAGKDAYQPMTPDRAERYRNRTASERLSARLKDDCGGRMVRVRGHAKVHAHLMFGLLVVFAEALLDLLP